MSEKATAAGWVVQVALPKEPETRAADAPWRPQIMRGSAPSFIYFNVAIAGADKAMEATTKHRAKDAESTAGEASVVRKLSSGEIAALRLEAGEVKPA